MNPRNTPFFLATLTTAALLAAAGTGLDRSNAAAQPADDHAGHDHGAVEPANDYAGHDHGGEAEHRDEVRLTDEAIAAYNIRTAPVTKQALADTVTAPARVGFNEEAMAHVAALLPGRIDTISARLGQQVNAGDVLLTVRSPELGQRQADYLSARSAAESAKPAVTLARDSFERARELLEGAGGISRTEVQQREAALRQAERELTAARADATAAANALRLYGVSDDALKQLGETGKVDPVFEVTAPIAGEIVERHATPGELIGPSLGYVQEPLLVIADLSTVWVGVDVPEARLHRVGVGSPASLSLPGLSNRAFTGTVTYVAPRIDAGSRTARLRVEMDNPDGNLRPGTFATAKVGPNRPSDQTLALPADAVMTVEGEPSVFVPVAGEPNTFARRPVTVGPRIGDRVPVLAGLEEGDQVVVNGGFILKADLGKAGAEHVH